MKLTFQTQSIGCRVNQAEQEELNRQLTQLGYTYEEKNPNLLILNSCSVTQKAEREGRQLIYQVKRTSPQTKIIVTGCAATNWIKLKTEIPEVDLLVDNQNKEYLAEIIKVRFSKDVILNSFQDLKEIPNQVRNGKLSQTALTNKYIKSGRVLIKIQEGCHRFCSYCIVPYLRGLPKSIPSQDIANKINSVGKEVREVILTAINTEAYGYDIKETFEALLDKILKSTKIERISLGSIHPWSINNSFLKFYRKNLIDNRLINFFHIPLQSGSNNILRLMKRDYTREEFEEKLEILNSCRPYTLIGTDVIVGFLGETDKDFHETYDFLKKSPISKFHIFRFSKREHTAAFYMSRQIKEPNPKIKIKRAKILSELGKIKYGRFLQSHTEQIFPTLILNKTVENYREGLLSNQIPVLIAASKTQVGEVKNVKIVEYKKGRLFGRIV